MARIICGFTLGGGFMRIKEAIISRSLFKKFRGFRCSDTCHVLKMFVVDRWLGAKDQQPEINWRASEHAPVLRARRPGKNGFSGLRPDIGQRKSLPRLVPNWPRRENREKIIQNPENPNFSPGFPLFSRQGQFRDQSREFFFPFSGLRNPFFTRSAGSQLGCTPRGSCNRTLLRRVVRRFFNSKCFLGGFLEGACKGFP